MQFSKDKCNVDNQAREQILKGIWTLDNYYGVSSTSNVSCHIVLLDKAKLWYQCLGYINFRDFSKFSKRKIIASLSKSLIAKKMICGSCQEGKQTRAQHKKVSNIRTSWPLELLYMDLKCPMITKSLGRKKYIMVIMDYFCRFTLTIL